MTRPRPDMSNKPATFESRIPLALREVVTDPETEARLINATNSYIRSYVLGQCTVLVTREYGRWHLSIAHPERYPTWDEIAEARYRLLPDAIQAAMILPPKSHYINMHPNCFQVIEVRDGYLTGEK